jgi:hypothetical protein
VPEFGYYLRRPENDGGVQMKPVAWARLCGGIAAAGLVLLVAPRVQVSAQQAGAAQGGRGGGAQTQGEWPNTPVAPYEEVKPWGPSVKGSLEWEPGGADTDRKGNLYFLRREDPTVWVMDPSGKVIRKFGEGLFAWAHGMYVDRQNNIWATDCTIGPGGEAAKELHKVNQQPFANGHGHQVYKFSPEGKLLMTIGKGSREGGMGPDQFHCPADVITAADGSIFVSDGHEGEMPNGRVVKFTKDGKYIKEFGKRGKGPGEFASPHALAFDSRGRLFVADRSNGRIQIFDQDGNFLEQTNRFGGPAGIAITSNDTMFVCCPRQVILVGSAKTLEITGQIKDVWAEGIAADDQGNVYAGEVFRHVWRKFSLKK